MLALTTAPRGNLLAPLLTTVEDVMRFVVGAELSDQSPATLPIPPTIAVGEGCFWFQPHYALAIGATAVLVTKNRPEDITVYPVTAQATVRCYLDDKQLVFGTVKGKGPDSVFTHCAPHTPREVPLGDARLIGYVVSAI
ncbi:hypothetical protein [Marinobacter sp.]|uniref:hypothetical protein n=1 Tax=Marinobacter sp. TaxID=50741 RepID=UPI003A92DDF2